MLANDFYNDSDDELSNSDDEFIDDVDAIDDAPPMQFKPNTYGKISKFFGFFRTVGTIYSCLAAVSIIGIFLYTIALVLILLCSFFILLAVPSFMSLFGQSDKAIALCVQIFHTLPIGTCITFISAILSSIFVRKDKLWVKESDVQVRNVIAIVLSVILTIIYVVIYWLIKSGNITFN
ncbi:MAG: hypothetical protein RR357_02750 [Clostridia bacterium]